MGHNNSTNHSLNLENMNTIFHTQFVASLTLAIIGIFLSICSLLFYFYQFNPMFRSFVRKVTMSATYFVKEEPEKNKESVELDSASVEKPTISEQKETERVQKQTESSLEESNIYDVICETPTLKTRSVNEPPKRENQQDASIKASTDKVIDNTTSRRNSTEDNNSLAEGIYSTIADKTKADNINTDLPKPKVPSIADVYGAVTKRPTATTFPLNNPFSSEENEESLYSTINEDTGSHPAKNPTTKEKSRTDDVSDILQELEA